MTVNCSITVHTNAHPLCNDLRPIWVQYLANISLSSCSDTNWPRLATNSVEHGPVLTPIPCWEEGDEPTGEARAGDGRKCGSEACMAVNAAVGCGMDKGGCKHCLLYKLKHSIEHYYYSYIVIVYRYYQMCRTLHTWNYF